jgi:hypothetical protein
LLSLCLYYAKSAESQRGQRMAAGAVNREAQG